MKGVWGHLSWVCPFSWQQKPDFLATSGHTHLPPHPPTHTRLPHVCIIDVLALCRVGPLGSARFTATLQVLKTFKAETHLTSAAPEHEHCVKSLKPDNHTKKTYVCVCVCVCSFWIYCSFLHDVGHQLLLCWFHEAPHVQWVMVWTVFSSSWLFTCETIHLEYELSAVHSSSAWLLLLHKCPS